MQTELRIFLQKCYRYYSLMSSAITVTGQDQDVSLCPSIKTLKSQIGGHDTTQQSVQRCPVFIAVFIAQLVSMAAERIKSTRYQTIFGPLLSVRARHSQGPLQLGAAIARGRHSQTSKGYGWGQEQGQGQCYRDRDRRWAQLWRPLAIAAPSSGGP